MEHLILHFEAKGQDFINEHLEAQRKKQAERDLMRKKTEAKLRGDIDSDEDDEEDSPGDESLN